MNGLYNNSQEAGYKRLSCVWEKPFFPKFISKSEIYLKMCEFLRISGILSLQKICWAERGCGDRLVWTLKPSSILYRVVRLNYIPEFEVFCMPFDRPVSIFTMTSVKKYIKYLNFQCKIKLDHLVLAAPAARCVTASTLPFPLRVCRDKVRSVGRLTAPRP